MKAAIQPGEIFDERYQLIEILGSGASGIVYRALQLDLKRDVALKILHHEFLRDDDSVTRFLREAKALGQLKHPNIVSFYHVGLAQSGLVYLSMELVNGKSLRSLLSQLQQIEPLRAVALCKQVAGTLSYVHKQGVVHRDLKPENIIILDNPEPDTIKLIDFGLAKLAAEQKLTSSGMLIGTAAYMSPEQCAGKPVDSKSDIYSLSVCLYEMLTGHPPFQADTPVGVLYKHLHEPPDLNDVEKLDFFHEQMNLLLKKGLAKEPGDRFADTDEMFVALTALHTVLMSEEAGSPSRKRKTSSRIKSQVGLLKTGILVSISALIAFSVFYVKNGKKHSGVDKLALVLSQEKEGLPDPKQAGTRITSSTALLIVRKTNSSGPLDQNGRKQFLDSYLSSKRLDPRARSIILCRRGEFEDSTQKRLAYCREAKQLAEAEFQRNADVDSCDIYLLSSLIYATTLYDLGSYKDCKENCLKMLSVVDESGSPGPSRIVGVLGRPKLSDYLLLAAEASLKQNDLKAANELANELEKQDFGSYRQTARSARLLIALERRKDVRKLIRILSEPYESKHDMPVYEYEAFMNFKALIELFRVCVDKSEWDLAEDCLNKAERVNYYTQLQIPNAIKGALEVELSRSELLFRRGDESGGKMKLLQTAARWVKTNNSSAAEDSFCETNPLNLLIMLLKHNMDEEAGQVVEVAGKRPLFFAPKFELPFAVSGDLEANRNRLLEILRPYSNKTSIKQFIETVRSSS